MKTKFIAMALAMAPALAIAPPLATSASAQTRQDQYRWDQAQRRFEREQALYEQERDLYERSRRGGYRDRGYGGDRGPGGYGGDDNYRWRGGSSDWDASRYYREDQRYEERRLGAEDEVYRGSDGRYYCRRSDGTTGLVVGAGVGALTGRAIDGGRNRAGGTIVGGVLGALIGREVERSQDMRCR
jgi:hypothetical protein